jgi:hypothetical protein
MPTPSKAPEVTLSPVVVTTTVVVIVVVCHVAE